MRRIAVAGGGVAGWLSASALAAAFEPGAVRVTLITAPRDAEHNTTFGVAAALAPEHTALHGLIGLSTRDLIAEADATFSLGAALRDWAQPGRDAFIPYGPIGEGAGFHHFWRRGETGEALSAFSLAAHAAPLNKFALPPRGREGLLRYGMHVDMARYAQALRTRAEARGVTLIEAEIADVAPDGAGGVARLALAGAADVEADLFVDCTGADARLLSALGAGFEDWSAVLPSTHVGYGRGAAGAEIAPCATRTARCDGWKQTLPLQSGDAWAVFSASADIEGAEAILPIRAGVRSEIWRGNCVAIAAAAGVIEPLNGLDLHLAHRGVLRLLSLLPQPGGEAGARAEYNRLMRNEFDSARDAACAHYALARRNDTAFWRARAAAPYAAALARKITQFKRRGRIPLDDEDMLLESDWAALFAAHGLWPERIDLIAEGADPGAVRAGLERMKASLASMAASMPRHRAFIEASLGRPG